MAKRKQTTPDFDWSALKVKSFTCALTDLNPYENNPRINKKAIPYVKRSIKRFGFIVPIVVDTAQTLVIAAGHTRHAAALQLCEEEGREPSSVRVLCISAEHLTPSQVRQFRLADNRVASFSKDDHEKLRAELVDLVADWNAADFGFVGDDWEDAPTDEDDDTAGGESFTATLTFPTQGDLNRFVDEQAMLLEEQYGAKLECDDGQ